jgi:hypothetical protein
MFPLAAYPGEGHFTEPTAGIPAGRRELVIMPQTGPGAACPGAGGFWVFDAAAVASAGWTTQLVTGWSVCIPAQLDRTQRISAIGLTSGSPR